MDQAVNAGENVFGDQDTTQPQLHLWLKDNQSCDLELYKKLESHLTAKLKSLATGARH